MKVSINYKSKQISLSVGPFMASIPLAEKLEREIDFHGDTFLITFQLSIDDINNPKIMLLYKDDGGTVKIDSLEKIGNPYIIFEKDIPGFYVHTETGNPYTAIDTCEFKDPVSRKWIDAVMYRRTDIMSKIYVRELSDFFTKFKKL